MEKDLQYYRGLPFTRRIERKKGGGEGEHYFTAEIEELPSLLATGPTRAEVLYDLDAVFDDYIESSLEWGDRIPEPESGYTTVVGAKVVLVPADKEIQAEAKGHYAQVGDVVEVIKKRVNIPDIPIEIGTAMRETGETRSEPCFA